MLNKLVGNRAFYKRVYVLTIPIMIQQGITNFVNMLDNVMVGRVGQAESTGVAVSNQLMFVFNLCVFGAISGAGIFGAQYFGKKDLEGVKQTFRFKILFCTLLATLGVALLYFKNDDLIMLYLKANDNKILAANAFSFAQSYLYIMLIGLIPYTIAQCYGTTLRETGESKVPMIAGVMAVVVNLSLNYVLIYGKLGAPRLGVNGAAIATVISRFVELGILVVYTLIKRKKCIFIIDAWKSPYISLNLIKQIFKKGMPLMLNEALWASGMATVNGLYAQRGIDVVAASNISQTFFNVFSVAFFSVGIAVGILLGHDLGAGKSKEEVLDTTFKLIAFSVFIGIIVAILYAIAAIFIPSIYNISDNAKSIATSLMQITALAIPIEACAHSSYFALRSGGKVIITLIFDCVFTWVVSVVAAFCLVSYTSLGILTIYFIVQMLNIIKCILGYIFIKRGSWIKTIVS
ncbi:MAG: MATE family efflux transporter [Clostridia bacterium]|nr:MATE family efflux transporter [Clostridia bacterium]